MACFLRQFLWNRISIVFWLENPKFKDLAMRNVVVALTILKRPRAKPTEAEVEVVFVFQPSGGPKNLNAFDALMGKAIFWRDKLINNW